MAKLKCGIPIHFKLAPFLQLITLFSPLQCPQSLPLTALSLWEALKRMFCYVMWLLGGLVIDYRDIEREFGRLRGPLRKNGSL